MCAHTFTLEVMEGRRAFIWADEPQRRSTSVEESENYGSKHGTIIFKLTKREKTGVGKAALVCFRLLLVLDYTSA